MISAESCHSELQVLNRSSEEKRFSSRHQPRGICAWSFAYALRAFKLYQFLPARKDRAGWILTKQYLRSAISIGASIE
jgi:hypothetical protein